MGTVNQKGDAGWDVLNHSCNHQSILLLFEITAINYLSAPPTVCSWLGE